MRVFVTAVIVGIGLYDLGVGLFMLLSSQPWLAHGPGTPWIPLGEAGPDAAVLGLFRRMGAFSLHAGVATVVMGALGYRRRELTWTWFGISALGAAGFAWSDATFFDGTTYLLVKRIIGALWALALIAHALAGRASVEEGAQ